MSEYTPTTEDVSEAYSGGRSGEYHAVTGPEFDRWLAAHDAEVRAGVVTEEPEGRRQFTAAYTTQTEIVHPLGDTTAVKADAQAVADEFTREDPEGPDYFVATRIMPPWVPAKQEAAEADA